MFWFKSSEHAPLHKQAPPAQCIPSTTRQINKTLSSVPFYLLQTPYTREDALSHCDGSCAPARKRRSGINDDHRSSKTALALIYNGYQRDSGLKDSKQCLLHYQADHFTCTQIEGCFRSSAATSSKQIRPSAAFGVICTPPFMSEETTDHITSPSVASTSMLSMKGGQRGHRQVENGASNDSAARHHTISIQVTLAFHQWWYSILRCRRSLRRIMQRCNTHPGRVHRYVRQSKKDDGICHACDSSQMLSAVFKRSVSRQEPASGPSKRLIKPVNVLRNCSRTSAFNLSTPNNTTELCSNVK